MFKTRGSLLMLVVVVFVSWYLPRHYGLPPTPAPLMPPVIYAISIHDADGTPIGDVCIHDANGASISGTLMYETLQDAKWTAIIPAQANNMYVCEVAR